MSRIDTIVWDVGNIFIYWDPRRVYADDPRFDDVTAHEWAERVIKSPWQDDAYGWNSLVDRGETIAATTAERISRFPQVFPELAARFEDYPALLRRYFTDWVKSIDEHVPGTRELRDALKAKGYRTFALTNFSAETWPAATALYPHLNEFDGIVMSGQVRMVKPDRDIYEHLFATHHIEPANAVFIDDSAPNIETARHLGMNAILFEPDRAAPQKALQQLKERLAALGVV